MEANGKHKSAEEYVSITREHYTELVEASDMLHALIEIGVRLWDGWPEAMVLLDKQYGMEKT